MNVIDTLTNSPHYFYWKRIWIANENLNFELGFKGLKFFSPFSQKVDTPESFIFHFNKNLIK